MARREQEFVSDLLAALLGPEFPQLQAKLAALLARIMEDAKNPVPPTPATEPALTPPFPTGEIITDVKSQLGKIIADIMTQITTKLSEIKLPNRSAPAS